MTSWLKEHGLALLVIIVLVIALEYVIVRKAVSDALSEIYVQEVVEIR